MGLLWEYCGNIVGILWKYCGNLMGILWVTLTSTNRARVSRVPSFDCRKIYKVNRKLARVKNYPITLGPNGKVLCLL